MNWHEMFEYRDGAIYWKRRNGVRDEWNTKYAGKRAGHLRKCDGYRRVTVECKRAYEHRIIFEMHHGALSQKMDVDHINGDKSDNRIENLRLATRSQNKINAPVYRTSKTGIRGVIFHKRMRKYQVSISVNGERRFLGSFSTLEEATTIRNAAAVAAYGEFTR